MSSIIRRSIVFYLLLFLQKLIAADKLTLKDAPCDYLDTVPVDFVNGSYMYGAIEVAANEIGVYNYQIYVGNKNETTEPHFRGCVCNIYNCISICCPSFGEFSSGQCLNTSFHVDEHINVTNDEKETFTVELNNFFVMQFYRPCNNLFYLQPQKYKHLNYSIMENGSLYKIEENRYYDKNSYCLSGMIHSPHEFLFTPLQCYAENPAYIKNIKLNGVALLISVPFMILTIIVYLSNPKLKTIYGLSLCCYLLGLSVGYLTLAYLILEPNEEFSLSKCSLLGYIVYFAFMSAFFWLSVISFDLYTNVQGSETNEMKIFRLYCLYAWGLAIISLICTYIAQNSTIITDSWKPGIGSPDSCFLNATHGWSALIYFYGPILLIVSVNTILFVLTFIQIRKRMQCPTYNDTHKPHNEHRALFMTFLRLFIIMGITWLAEILAYVTPHTSWLHNIFRITDFLNGIQGVIIFFLFVICRKSVRTELLKKYGTSDGLANKYNETKEENIQFTPLKKTLSNTSKTFGKSDEMQCEQPQEMEKII